MAAAAGMRSSLEALDLLANNIANASTAGYKADRDSNRPYVSADASESWPDAVQSPQIERHWTDFSQGALSATGQPFDLAVSGNGFLEVQTPQGARWTRNGAMRVNAQGKLETKEGYPLRVKPASGNTYQLNPLAPAEITPDGVIRQGGQNIGTIEVMSFDQPTALDKQGASYFRMDMAGITAKLDTASKIQQGYLEQPNGGVSDSAVKLVNVMRQFETLQKAVAIGAEMNKKAVEEVARPA